MMRFTHRELSCYQAKQKSMYYLVLDILEKEECNTVILGAFGCGFKKVIFAIPNSKSVNHRAFKEVYDDCRNGIPHSYDTVEGPMADDQIILCNDEAIHKYLRNYECY